MKKVFFLIALLFTVVCYASPPPLLTTDIVTANVEFVVQNDVNVPVYTVEALEVAFVYLGHFELMTCYAEFGLKQVNDLSVPEATVTDVSYLQLSELNKPPALTDMQAFNQKFQLNKQNSNYGYPLTGDTCRS